MAITPMAKVMIVCHRSQVSDLLEALQEEGICQVLGADEAAVSRDAPELVVTRERPRDIEEVVSRLERSLGFLKEYAPAQKGGLGSLLAPRPVVDARSYNEVVTDVQALAVADRADQLQVAMEKTRGEIEHFRSVIEMLGPWKPLQTPVEEIGRLRTSICWAGLVPAQHFNGFEEQLADLGAAIQKVGAAGTREACIVAALRENIEQVQKLLRSHEFEIVSFEPMAGMVPELIQQYEQKLADAKRRLEEQKSTAADLARNFLKIEILHDHYRNVLTREKKRDSVPATQQTRILEGWCRKRDYKRLEQVVSRFSAANVMKVELAPGDEAPVDIENSGAVRPFEVVTRLYGMPHHLSVDPTKFLAPFFAVFFGMCIADAGYGILMLGVLALFIWKMQGDKKLLLMMALCAVATIVVGALTGGWFGNAIQKFILHRDDVDLSLWFDPFKSPLLFFGVAVSLGYIQLVSGLIIAFVHNLRRKDYMAATFDQLDWIVLLNSIVLFGLGKVGVLPAVFGTIFGYMALIAAAAIFLFSHREGGIGARLGMGFYNIFSAVFYLGDVLSYLRLMALGMVGAGLAMAINVIAEVSAGIPWIGPVIAVLVFIGGHVFNLVLAILSAFVHTLRLQYVEFFPKFLAGGGREFSPLAKDYQHIYIEKAAR